MNDPYYVEWDEQTGSYLVFNSLNEVAHAYSSFMYKADAFDDARARNLSYRRLVLGEFD